VDFLHFLAFCHVLILPIAPTFSEEMYVFFEQERFELQIYFLGQVSLRIISELLENDAVV